MARGRILALLVACAALNSCTSSATDEEKAILAKFLPMIQDQDCVPGWTTTGLPQAANRQWLELDAAGAARLESASRKASARNESVAAGSLLSAAIWSFACPDNLRVGTPAFFGRYAFVTTKGDGGTETSAFEKQSGRWVWISMKSEGKPIIQY